MEGRRSSIAEKVPRCPRPKAPATTMEETMKRLGTILLGAGVVLGVAATFAGTASADDDVRLRLNWMYYGSHAGFALGKDKGYYKDQGINLDIRSGNGSGSAHRL